MDHIGLREPVDWVEAWRTHKRATIEAMIVNITADLKDGYDPIGLAIIDQLVKLHDYRAAFERESEIVSSLNVAESRKFCLNDLRQNGVI